MPVDLLHLFRSLRRSPASAVAAIATLALTVGAGAAIFAVVDAILLTPPPFVRPDALVTLGEVPAADRALSARAVPYRTFALWRERAAPLAAVEAYDPTNLTLTARGFADRVSATDVSSGFLAMLGVRPALGRGFSADDIGRPLAIISDSFWRSRFAADSRVIGRELMLGGQPHTIVGVLPERFRFALNPSDIWRPFPNQPAQAANAGQRLRIMARLLDGVTPSTLQPALDDVSRLASPPARAVVTPLGAAVTGRATPALGVLAGAAALALLLACANLAGLLVVRSADRRREFAVRNALGAGGGEIVRQLLLESMTIAVIGTALGVLLAFWATPVVAQLALEQFGAIANRDIAVRGPAVGVVALVTVLCACLCGWLTAAGASRRQARDGLRRGINAAPRASGALGIVGAEMALAFVLLASMTLLGRSLLQVLAADPGFDPRGVQIAQVSLPPAYDGDARRFTFYTTLLRALTDRLGTRAATIDEIPLEGDRGRTIVHVRARQGEGGGGDAVLRRASPGYFEVMRIPVVAGRSFGDADGSLAPARAVISQSLAWRLFASAEAVGSRLWLSGRAEPAEVVGVVGDVTHGALDEAATPTVYLSAWQSPPGGSIVVVRHGSAGGDVIGAIRDEVAALDASLPVYGTGTMADVVAASPGVSTRRLLTATFMTFAVLAVVLSGIGLFGAAAHDAAGRRRDVALRLALGAEPSRILSAAVRRSALMIGSGLAAGFLLSLWALRALAASGLAAEGFDPVSVALPAIVLLAVAAVAVLPPARRASLTSPLLAMRGE